ncbi:hypothetical protein Cgig2_022415 [Carnegiea gigantea]|uniref:Uncharacterized protein n=1 Tax=Carnegiea gigantea TaxID=171969 RepID=A0A9Q1JHQ7_9CARY|nr:hypothetical protein Cgig2_022415 [Carnegiea gigantea]
MRVLSLCSVKPPPSHLSYIICSLNNSGTLKNSEPTSVKWSQKHSIGTAATGAALSLGLLLFSPPSLSLAADSFSAIEPSPLTPSPSMEHKKDNTLSSSIRTRLKAHDTIRRMLASLGDPYTHFLTPDEGKRRRIRANREERLSEEKEQTTGREIEKRAKQFCLNLFSKMARYDMTGIGINLREIPDGNGDIKLKVLGLILDGVAHAAGVRQKGKVTNSNYES